MPRKKKPVPEKPRVHEDLKGFAIGLDAMGAVTMNRSTHEISDFLRKHVPSPPPTPSDGREETEEETP